jgi:uncharacterized membrane-anchored protein
MNVQIVQKESIKNDGEVIYFKLAPVDPRAFMLGDYMALNFEHNLHNYSDENIQTFIVTLNDQKIVIDAEIYKGSTVKENQRLFKIQDKLRPDRFYFQEGHAQSYEKAKYGLFRYVSPSQFLLDDMTDEGLIIINPQSKSSE